MKNIILIALACVGLAFTNHSGGVYSSNTGNIHFYSHTPVEDIEADNHKVKTAFDSKSGKIQFSVLIKDFQFEKALMQEHFNENYMESTKFPKATFNGTIDKIEDVKVDVNGTYTFPISGKLTIKDVTKDVHTTATFKVLNDVVNGKASFTLNPEDYNIEIPNVVSKKISRDIKISIDVDYQHKH